MDGCVWMCHEKVSRPISRAQMKTTRRMLLYSETRAPEAQHPCMGVPLNRVVTSSQILLFLFQLKKDLKYKVRLAGCSRFDSR